MSIGPVSKDLIVRAVRAESGEDRALATQAIGRLLRDRELSHAERHLSARLFDILSKDVCDEVRRALAITLRLSPNLPRSTANRLIQDMDSIAVPILSDSPSVTDEDLLAIVQSRASAKVRAVATRNGVSPSLSAAVLRHGDRESIVTLAANDTALISPEDARSLVDLADQDDLIREAALRRSDMPQDLALRLIDRQVETVDESLASEIDHHRQIADHTGERAKASWTASDWSSDSLLAFVDALAAKDGLGSEVVARAAGQGDWRFVQVALARLAGISPAKARMMVLDPRPFGLMALLQRTPLSKAARTLVTLSAEAFRDLQLTSATVSRRRFQRLMAERIASHPGSEAHEALFMDWLDEGLSLKAV
ncbi:MAG: DUF2336 domain-containing protein [Litorimonas sp.]